MSELLLSDGENTTVLPQTEAEKARQVPDPVTYHLLCVLPKAEEEYESGLAKAGQTMHFEEVMSPVLFVAKMGPDCYKDPLRFPSGPSCKVGDFVGVTDDFAWYELSRMRVRLDEMVTMLDNLQNTLKARSVEQQSYMNYLEGKVRMLKELVPQETKE